MSDFVMMHGLSLDGSGEMKEQEVHKNNVAAFERAGWQIGEKPKEWSNDLGAIVYTEEDAKAQAGLIDDYPESEPKPARRKKSK